MTSPSPTSKLGISKPDVFRTARGFLACFTVMVIMAFVINIYMYIDVGLSQTTIIWNKYWLGEARNKLPQLTDLKNNTRAMFNMLTNTPSPSIKNCTAKYKLRHLMNIQYGGRLGNAIFQLATLISTAERMCYTAIRGPGLIKEFDRIFDLKNVENIDKYDKTFQKLPEPGWSKFDANITKHIKPELNCTLLGYRQSYRYFSDYAILVRSSFCFKNNIKTTVANYLKSDLLVRPLVGVHVRRGDIVGARETRPSNMDYLSRSISYIKDRLGTSMISLVVVSDDISWCRRNIKGDNIFYSPFHDAGQDLYLLTQCDHHVITTGSYGWMGAWLNETGIVIYDKLFPVPNSKVAKGHNPGDYYPSHWIGM